MVPPPPSAAGPPVDLRDVSDPPTQAPTDAPGAGVRVPLAVVVAALGALLHQIAVYAPALEFRAGDDSFSQAILSFTDGFRATLPHLAVTVLGLAGAFLAVRRRALGAGLLAGAGLMSLVTFTIAGRGVWWAASAGSLPLGARFGLYLGIAAATLLLVAAVLALRGTVGGGRGLPAIALASFFLGAWLLPWLAWRVAEEAPGGLDVGALGWLGRAMVATAFFAVALALAGWRLEPGALRGRGLGTATALALVLLVVGLVAGWSLVRILHAAAWGALGAVLGLYLVALASALPRPSLPAALGVGGLGLLTGALLLPVLTTETGAEFRPIPVGDVPVADLLPGAVNEIPPVALAALGVALLRYRDLAAGLLIAAAVAAIPWPLLFPLGGVEIGMWLGIGGLLLVAAAAWVALATSERRGSEPPSPR